MSVKYWRLLFKILIRGIEKKRKKAFSSVDLLPKCLQLLGLFELNLEARNLTEILHVDVTNPITSTSITVSQVMHWREAGIGSEAWTWTSMECTHVLSLWCLNCNAKRLPAISHVRHVDSRVKTQEIAGGQSLSTPPLTFVDFQHEQRRQHGGMGKSSRG